MSTERFLGRKTRRRIKAEDFELKDEFDSQHNSFGTEEGANLCIRSNYSICMYVCMYEYVRVCMIILTNIKVEKYLTNVI